MVDASYWTHAATVSRRTRGNMRTYAAQMVGLDPSNLSATDSAVLNRLINDEQEEWRMDFPGVRGFGERSSGETWTVGNTRHELPADFAELSDGGRITLMDTSGNENTQLEVITKSAYEQEWRAGSNRYEDRSDPVAYLWGVSTNGKRLIEILPTPTTAIQFKVYYTAFLENLDNDNDSLEAPLGMHPGIEAGIASRFCLFKGSPRTVEFRAEAERIKTRFRNPVSDERKRPGIMRSFLDDSVAGYEAFEHAE